MPVHADVNDFIITSFTSDQTLTKIDPQGSLHIIETISVVFTDNNHGIIRAIPNDYNSKPLNFHLNMVTSPSGAPTQVNQSFSNNNVVLKIGDPNKTITGAHQYIIDYEVENVISFYSDYDELYWDVSGDQWQQPITDSKVILHIPTDLKLSAEGVQCFAGSYGQTEKTCTINSSLDGLTATTRNLPAAQTLTYVAGFTKGYFQTETNAEKVQDNLNPLLSLIVLPVAALCGAFVWWWRKGRDAKGRGVIVPEYEPPKNMLPIDAGTVLDFRTDNRDITATIIDLAIKNYIRIHETVTKRKLRKDKIEYELELIQTDWTPLRPYESDLLAGIFARQEVGEKLKIGHINTQLAKVAQDIRNKVPKNLKTEGFFAESANKYGIYLLIFVAIFATTLAIIFGNKRADFIPEIIIGAIISVVTISLFWGFMSARTTKGVRIREQLLGLKMYMEMSEKDRIEKLQSPNAEYAEHGPEPTRTVELFEKLLPFAIVMGVEKQWAKQFESLYTSAPSWYAGNSLSSFNSVYLANSLSSNMGSAINTSFTPPSSSGSSGFSGGGFSGGGGGGGGGGGW